MNLNTKQDFNDLLFDILNPIKKYYSASGAGIKFGSHATWYDDNAARCEAFSRPLWGLVPFLAGGGCDREFEDIYLRGLTSGTDRKNPDYFGDCRDRDQRFVEMAAMAYAILMCPDKLWEPLSDNAKDNLCDWLNRINQNEVCDSNWTFFRILVNIALKSQSREYCEERLRKDLKRIDDFYISDGWYKDGVKGQKDYYIPFAIHFYSLIYARFMEKNDPERCKIYKERATEFAKTFIYWFADNGEALPYGRSLTYRFAQISFFSACLLADVYPFPIGVMKGIIVRNFMKWYESDMFDNAHILNVGYKYQNLIMAEHYNAYGSPYWGLKAFAFLALPDSHEFFSAECEPLPKLDEIKKITPADMIIKRQNGEVFAYPAGTHEEFGCGQIIPKYLKFAYSTKFGFNVPCSNNISVDETAPDNMLVFVLNNHIFVRNHSDGFTLNDSGLKTIWSAFSDIKVETDVIITPNGHKRIHKIVSPYDLTAYDCGFAVASRDKDECKTEISKNCASAKNNFSYCKISGGGEGVIINASANTNIMYNKTVIPAIKYDIKKGQTVIETEIEVE